MFCLPSSSNISQQTIKIQNYEHSNACGKILNRKYNVKLLYTIRLNEFTKNNVPYSQVRLKCLALDRNKLNTGASW